ncbi:ABC transporter permease [Microcella daejeonensis]|uniref:ABC transporter permease n=1 Tax=Microcella daejeonensis TaxID=2994971 RepID=A0A9E8MMI9_9MICO|nr:ABC transporter permease [Microcella daejeonensis]WAB82233.1 ABC transporter permease [Microcella daejeonensis]
MTTTQNRPQNPAPNPRSSAAEERANRNAAAPRLSFPSAVGLVAGREITSRIRSKSFIISTVILLVAVLASIVVSGLVSRTAGDDTTPVAAVGGVASVFDEVEGYEVTDVGSVAEAEALVEEGEVDAAVVPVENPVEGGPTVEVIALESAPGGLLQALAITPEVRLLEPAPAESVFGYLVAFGFGLLFLFAASTFGGTIAQSVVEEKQTRIVEILLSAVPARALLAGKVLGNSVLALGQIVAIAVLAAVGLMVIGQDVLLSDLGPSVLWFLVFFAIGFVLLASMYAAAASLVSRMEDTGAVLAPLIYLVMVPYFLVIFFYENDLVLTIMSYVPFSAPVGMPMRVFLGSAQWWEPLVSLVVLAVSTALVVALGARIYQNSLLRTGGRVKLTEALKG